MKKIKLAVFVSGGGTNLQALIDAQKNGIIENGEIKLVVSSNPNAYAVVRAEKEGITTAIAVSYTHLLIILQSACAETLNSDVPFTR